ncbi:FYN-binding protein 1 isoform X2 [Colossoma macropomum]|uniref:FYN-binding protein 1 isoform X2 n=1 Tax=Colossoma macropomum TaxID=42526 RepID=UPI0018640752|nr:FYN-binding protein 1 isoform X2 [Colossoma macropomum]
MDNKSDVKAIMARFQAGGTSMEAGAGGRPKAAVHPTLSGPTVPSKKPVLETSLSGSAAANSSTPKPSYLKNTVSTKSAPEARESPKPKALVSRFENTNTNEDSKPPFAKPLKPKLPDSSQDTEQKPQFPKAPLHKASTSITAPDSKNTFPKPPPVTSKPSWASKAENNGSSPNTGAAPKMPATLKPKSTISSLLQQPDEAKDADPLKKPFSGVKQSSFRAAQSVFNKTEEVAKDEAKSLSSKESPASNPAIAPKPSYRRKPSGSSIQSVNDDPSAPKKKPLPNILALGTPPSKPNRPPRVNLDKFKKAAESSNEGPELKKGGPPPPLASHPSSQTASNLPPSLPPRPPGAIIQPDQDENYDDVGELKDSFMGNSGRDGEGSGSDGDMYEDLDERWSAVEAREQDKKREKEEKKRVEQEKKDQKERERKEQEARKKFKLTGPLQVIHKVKARVDCKGGKNDLSIKQGEPIDVLRIIDNPEGRWLARTQDGSYGYVKTESVQIDFDKLRNQGLSLPSHMDQDDGEVYDDVAPQDDLNRSNSGPGVVLPPPPEGDGDVYDDLDDPSLMVSPESKFLPNPLSFFRMLKVPIERRKSPVCIKEVPPPPQFNQDGNTDQSSAPGCDEIYDDVDAFPAPPPLSSLPQMKPKAKAEVKIDDPKKQKKFEKEEKEFRKKFKFEAEIQVLYQVTVGCSKKGSGKDLTVQTGEVLDVIHKPEHDKLICRNKEGKFGYVSVDFIRSEDIDIYDDIGDDCIYDND